MSFRLDTGIPLGDALRRTALNEIDCALAEIPRDVHEARKRCKKLRALLRLLRRPLGKRYAPLNRRLQDTAHALAPQRAVESIAEIWQALTKDLTSDLAQAVGPGVRRHVRQHLADYAVPPQARQSLAAIRKQITTRLTRTVTVADLEAGLLDTYRTARQRYRKALRSPTPSNLHEWRKKAKYHGYQCALLAPLWPALGGRRIPPLKQLSDGLGQHHDLEELRRVLNDATPEFGRKSELRKIDKAIAARQNALCKQALRIGATLFGAKPRAWWAAVVMDSTARRVR